MKKIKFSTVVSVVLGAFLMLLLLSPDTRTWVSRGLMKFGLFKPNLERAAEERATEPMGGGANASVFVSDGQGNQIDVANQSGKVVFINFWATWCPPCLYEMPSIQKLKEHFQNQEDVVFLMVDVDADLDGATQFLKNKEFDLPVYVMATSIPESWLGNAIPCTIVLDKKGQLVYRQEGAANYDRSEFKDFMQKLINETP